MDGTPFAAFSRPVRASSPTTATDPDADWYVREGDHRDPDTLPASGSGSNRSRRRGCVKTLFGYDATLLTLTPTPLTLPGLPVGTRLPSVTVAMSCDPPGIDPGGNAVRAASDARHRGLPAGPLAADRAFNNSDPDTFQLPIRALGYRPLFDYPRTALGIQQPGPAGSIMIEGSWACPHTPRDLAAATATLHQCVDAAGDDQQARADARAAWVEQITQRQMFLLAPKGRADAGGHQRYRCPAAAKTVRCPLKPASLTHYRPGAPLLDPEPIPGGGDLDICTQQSITIEPAAGAKHWQPIPYGTTAWQDAYHAGRSTVEGVNGHAKDGAFEDITDARGRRIRGLGAQSLLLAFQLAHANTRKIANWLAALPRPGIAPTRRPPRRKTRPLGQWTPRGYLRPDADGEALPQPP